MKFETMLLAKLNNFRVEDTVFYEVGMIMF